MLPLTWDDYMQNIISFDAAIEKKLLIQYYKKFKSRITAEML